jgi:hypothetical protein
MRNPIDRINPSRFVSYILGCVLFAIGVKLFITSGLGTDPFNAMVIGIVDLLDVSYIRIGVVSGAITLFALGIWSVWNGRRPVISPFITMALVGFLVDLLNEFEAERLIIGTLDTYTMLVAGLLVDAYASSLIIMSGFGIRVMDLIAITFVNKLGWRFTQAKLLLEVGFVCVAWSVGGPVGLATLLFVLIVGSLIEPFMIANGRILKMDNHGVPSKSAAPAVASAMSVSGR